MSRAPQAYQEQVYDRIFDLCKIARALDPTRQWVQSDGDKDLNGRLDVWLIHCGGEHTDTIPPNKVWGVTEGGSSYYGKPEHYEKYVGDRAYRSFKDRMDALAKEDYSLIRSLRQQDADIMNVWNLVWHALKPTPLGLKEVSKRQLDLTDGVFFGPYVEGKPGLQPERLAPFSTTVNPGYDPALPLIDPHPLYPAMQAAMHPDGLQPCEGDHFDVLDLYRKLLAHLGPKEIFAVYFSYWVYCPLDLSDLLNSGPDLPKVSLHCYVSDTCKLYLNGHLLKPAASTPADYRTRLTYQDLPLKQGWNHFLIKVASGSYHSADPDTLAVRLFSANKAFEGQLKTAVQITQSGGSDLEK